MFRSRPFLRLPLLIFLIVLVSLFTVDIAAAQKKGSKGKKDAAIVIDEAQLQGQMMAFADRYWSIMNLSFSEKTESGFAIIIAAYFGVIMY